MLTQDMIELALSRDPESTILDHLARAVHRAPPVGRDPWRPGKALELFMAGYIGAGNMGSEMRSGEIVRQIRHLLGANVSLRALSMNGRLDETVFPGVAPVAFQRYIPDDLANAVASCDGVIACEGSMFKSTFSDALSAVMSSALGMATGQGKLAVGFGAEIAPMSDRLRRFVQANTLSSLILCRNEFSLAQAETLGLRSGLGADTAWTFHAAERSAALQILLDAGWNGSDPVIAVCPINPFWWPVVPDPKRALALHRSPVPDDLHYGSIFFFSDSMTRQKRYGDYIGALARALRRIASQMKAFPIVIGMERVDARASRDLSERAGLAHGPIMGEQIGVASVVALLRASALLISSRFHAILSAMPASVPSIGVSMDERIANLFGGAGPESQVIPVEAEDLEDRIVAAAGRLDREQVRLFSRAVALQQVKRVGTMGMQFADEVAKMLPDYPMPPRPRHWSSHLPTLPRLIEDILSETPSAACLASA